MKLFLYLIAGQVQIVRAISSDAAAELIRQSYAGSNLTEKELRATELSVEGPSEIIYDLTR